MHKTNQINYIVFDFNVSIISKIKKDHGNTMGWFLIKDGAPIKLIMSKAILNEKLSYKITMVFIGLNICRAD